MGFGISGGVGQGVAGRFSEFGESFALVLEPGDDGY
jgi:hypothetical protein